MQPDDKAAALFETSLQASAPPADWPPPLRGLWRLAKGDWDAAHELVQHEAGADSAWVHAHLHRIEGDEWNAGYWYRRAGQPVGTGTFEAERRAIASTLLQQLGHRG